MFVADITCSIDVCVELEAAGAAEKKRLRTAIGAMLKATAGAGLAGVTRVYPNCAHTTLLGFVDQELLELVETPGELSPPRRTAVLLGALSYLAQVLNDNDRARLRRLDNMFGEHMIVVSALPKLFPTQLLEMSPS